MASPSRGHSHHQPSPGTLHTAAYTAQLLQELGLQSFAYHSSLQSRLDREASARSAIHRAALAAAYEEHERVLRNAQWAQEKLEADIARQREVEDLRTVQRNHREETERFEREIQEQRQLLEQRRQDAEAEKERVRDELIREEQAARDREQRREEEEQRERDRQRQQQEQSQQINGQGAPGSQASGSGPQPTSTSAPTPQVNSTAPAQTIVSSEDREGTHKQYLGLHRRLKEMRKNVLSMLKSNPDLKKQLGEMRRSIKKSVGQLTKDPSANMVPLRTIKQTLETALMLPNIPTLDVTPFIISQPIHPGAPSQMSAPFIYLISIFAKAIISQFIDECSVSPRSADPIGIVAISIFANNDLRAFPHTTTEPDANNNPTPMHRGTSLIDILLAKFHRVCPILFLPATPGLDESTPHGRLKLGWWRDPESGAFVSEQRHAERMTGLGAGFAALTLRNFANARSANPMPPRTYWAALAGLVNVGVGERPGRVTQTHCLVLRAMIEGHVSKFVGFYGQAAVEVLRLAVVKVPERVEAGAASTGLATLREVIRRDCHLTL